MSHELAAHFGDTLFNTFIPRNVRLAEAPAHGMPIDQYEPSSKGAKAYQQLADEVIAQSQKLQLI